MSDQQPLEATSLSPELQVFAKASPLWFKRFDQLARYIWLHLDEPLTVEQLAKMTHLSVYHFHRMFGSAFGEPIGSYIRRARLIKAVGDLHDTDRSVIDIAMDCGFSSSQALAKALKKQTNMTPTQVRKSISQQGMTDMLRLHSSLGRPVVGNASLSQEQQMAEELEFMTQAQATRYYRCVNVENPTMDRIYKTWKKTTTDKTKSMVTLTFAHTESMAFEDMDVWVGDECAEEEATHSLLEGSYLTTRISVTSTLGYFSAWEAMANNVMYSGQEFDQDAPMLEITHNPTALFAAVDMTISARLIENTTT